MSTQTKTTTYQIGDIVRCTLPARNNAGSILMGERNALVLGLALQADNTTVDSYYVLRFSAQFHKQEENSDIVISHSEFQKMGIKAFNRNLILRTNKIDIVRPEEILRAYDSTQNAHLFWRIKNLIEMNGAKFRKDGYSYPAPKKPYAQSLCANIIDGFDLQRMVQSTTQTDPYTLALNQRRAQAMRETKGRSISTPTPKF